MKKILVALAAVAFSATLLADEAKTTFTAGVSGTVYSTGYQSVIKDDNGSYTAVRMRPLFTLSNGTTEAVLKLEYDGLFGSVNKATDGKSDEAVAIGGDQLRVEVAQAYFTSKVNAVAGLSVIAGIASYDYMLVLGDNVPLAGFSYEKESFTLAGYYIKPYEGENSVADDQDIFVADFTMKFGDSSIRPALFVIKTGKNARWRDSYDLDTDPDTDSDPDAFADGSDDSYDVRGRDGMIYIPALTANLAFGSFGVDATVAYATGSGKVTTDFATGAETDMDYSGYALDIAPYYAISEAFKLTGFFSMISGDDPNTADEDESFITATVDGGGSGINLYRLYIIEDSGSFTSNSDVGAAGKYSNTSGYMAAGLVFEGSFGSVSTTFKGAYVQAMEVASGQDKDMGIELDANISYELSAGTTLFVEGAYLKAGKFYDTFYDGPTPADDVKKQDAYYGILGLSYDF